jgi:hypothetical protein
MLLLRVAAAATVAFPRSSVCSLRSVYLIPVMIVVNVGVICAGRDQVIESTNRTKSTHHDSKPG